MKKVVAFVEESALEQRGRLGLDGFDEVWDGVLHMNPPPSWPHQRFADGLRSAMHTLLCEEFPRVLVVRETALADPACWTEDYRVPDISLCLDQPLGPEEYLQAANLVVEVLSGGEDPLAKLPFYASRSVSEVLIVDRESQSVWLHVLTTGRYEAASPDEDGGLTSQVTELRFRFEDGALAITRNANVMTVR